MDEPSAGENVVVAANLLLDWPIVVSRDKLVGLLVAIQKLC